MLCGSKHCGEVVQALAVGWFGRSGCVGGEEAWTA